MDAASVRTSCPARGSIRPSPRSVQRDSSPSKTSTRARRTLPVPASYLLPSSGENNSAAFLASDGTTVCRINRLPIARSGNPPRRSRRKPTSISTARASRAPMEAAASRRWAARCGSASSPRDHPTRPQGRALGGPVLPVLPAHLAGDERGRLREQHNVRREEPRPRPWSLARAAPDVRLVVADDAAGEDPRHRAPRLWGIRVDDVYANGWGLCFEQSPAGRVVDEVQTLYGLSLSPNSGEPLMKEPRDHLRVAADRDQ